MEPAAPTPPSSRNCESATRAATFCPTRYALDSSMPGGEGGHTSQRAWWWSRGGGDLVVMIWWWSSVDLVVVIWCW